MPDSISQVIWTAFLLGVAAGIISLLLTRLLLCLLPKWGMVDKPDFSRHIHTHAIPRGGGLAIFVSFAALLLLFTGIHPPLGKHACQEGFRLLAPLCILIPLGVIDDRIGLKARTKFLFQIAAAAIAWILDYRLAVCFGHPLPPWLCLPLTILWIVAFINAFNMIDGVDGLASGIGIISDTDAQPQLFNSHLCRFAICTVAKIVNIEEIANQFKIEPDAVYQRVNRIMNKLRKYATRL